MASLERRVAVDAARAAGRLLRDELSGARRIAYKGSPTNLVTEMDQRAEALILLSTEESVTAAVGECDAAIALLSSMPAAADVRFERRLAVAHQNRGVALHALGLVDAAAHAFIDALAAIEAAEGEQIPDRSRLRAAMWTNLANARAS